MAAPLAVIMTPKPTSPLALQAKSARATPSKSVVLKRGVSTMLPKKFTRTVTACAGAEKSTDTTKGPSCPGYPNCGCNGEGRVPGGMTAILAATNNGVCPDWWPIKVYKPCPKFLEAGNAYKAGGQSVDDIFFGGGSTTEDFLSGKDL